MASLVYFKFKASVKTDSIAFDGSAISVKDLKSAIRTKCCLYSADFDLKLEDSSGKEFTKDNELIPKYTSIVVRRVPKLNADAQKRKANIASSVRDIFKPVSQSESIPSNINLAESDLPEDEKIRIMMERSSEIYSDKNFVVKAKPFGFPPPGYICHKCNLSGHWIHNCPGIRDQAGRLMDSKSVKRPTGIPQDFLLEVEADTPGAYLGKTGRYMVPIKDLEAYAVGKKEKRPFTVEENPPYVPPTERKPPKHLICPLCNKLFQDAVVVSCCGSTYCNDCIMGHVFDSGVLGCHTCPSCGSTLNEHENNVFEIALVRSMVRDWIRSIEENKNSDQCEVPPVIPIVPDAPEKVVRRVLKPRQPALPDSTKQHSPANESTPRTEHTSDSKTKSSISKSIQSTKTEISSNPGSTPEPLCPKTSTFSKSEPFINNIKNYSFDSENLPIVSNTCNSVANMPCATLVEAVCAANAVPTASISSSNFAFNRGALPVLPNVIGGENTNLLNAMYGANLVGMAPIGTNPPVAQLPNVYQNVSLLPSGFLWPTTDISYLNGVDQNALINQDVYSTQDQNAPIFGIYNEAVDDMQGGPFSTNKMLSKEEFYRMKMRLIQKSLHIRSPHSGEASKRHFHSRAHKRERRRESPPSRRVEGYQPTYSRELFERHDSRGRRNRRRSRSRSAKPVEDYDTWRRRKERSKRFERDSPRNRLAARSYRPISPADARDVCRRFHPNNAVCETGGSPVSATELFSPRPMRPKSSPLKDIDKIIRQSSPCLVESDVSYNRGDSRQINVFINPEKESSPTMKRPSQKSVVPEYTISDTASSRGPTPSSTYRLNSPPAEISPVNLNIECGRLSDDANYNFTGPFDGAYEELGARALKKLKKEEKRKRKEERRARKAARALKDKTDFIYDGVGEDVSSKMLTEDAAECKSKHKKRRKHKEKREGSPVTHRKHKKSKKCLSSPKLPPVDI